MCTVCQQIISELDILENYLINEKYQIESEIVQLKTQLDDNKIEYKKISKEEDIQKKFFSPKNSITNCYKNEIESNNLAINEQINENENKIHKINEHLSHIKELKKQVIIKDKVNEMELMDNQNSNRKNSEENIEEYNGYSDMNDNIDDNSNSAEKKVDSDNVTDDELIEIKKSALKHIRGKLETCSENLQDKMDLLKTDTESSFKDKDESLFYDMEKNIKEMKNCQYYIKQLEKYPDYCSLQELLNKLADKWNTSEQKIVWNIDSEVEQIDMEKKKTLMELCEIECRNAFTYMDAEQVMITAKVKDDIIKMVIADDGNSYHKKDLERDKYSDNDLEWKYIKEKCEKICSKYSFESEKHVGTTICIEF